MKTLAKYLVWIIALTLIGVFVVMQINYVAYPIKYETEVVKASNNYHIPRNLLLSVIREESRFNPDSQSNAGAQGLMQLLPSTAEWVAGKRQLTYKLSDIRNPEINIDYGAWYLQYLRDQFHDDTLAIEAYNAGITNVAAWQKKNPGYIAFAETDLFVKKVKQSWQMYDTLYGVEWTKKK